MNTLIEPLAVDLLAAAGPRGIVFDKAEVIGDNPIAIVSVKDKDLGYRLDLQKAVFLDGGDITGFQLFAPAIAQTIQAHQSYVSRLLPEDVGDIIGPYRLLQEIGHGGFGVVWMVEQSRPVRRRVALKIVKLGMDTKEVVARFEQERQALALMDHPNIARVFDAGVTPSGRPYFVMELVRGVKLTEFCDQHDLSLVERLELFIRVCHAVHHAHQKGIIHRDLKPSNILVGMVDGVPMPKIIDFGVAKAMQSRIGEHSLYTEIGQIVGTPLYMSPEQGETTTLDIDTRSDVYSLGVLLYELLTGNTPFTREQMEQNGVEGIRKIIREQEPQRPSTALATIGHEALAAVAKHRHTEAPHLVGILKRDLDWIVMRAIEKDRNRRYDSASALAEDIERHLRSEPVVARPPTIAYRTRRLVMRNKGAFVTAAIVSMALVLGTGVSVTLAVRVAAQAERATAEAAARSDAEGIIDFLATSLRSPDIGRDGRTVTVAETLDLAARKVESELSNQPARQAKLQLLLGGIYSKLGLPREAIILYEKAVATERMLSAGNSVLLRAIEALALSYEEDGRKEDAIALRKEILNLRGNSPLPNR